MTGQERTQPTPDRSYGFRQGHTRVTKHPQEVRVFSQNVNGVPHDKSHDKSVAIINYLKSLDGNTVTLWQEIQLFWPKVPGDSRWNVRDKKPNFTTVFGYNRLEDPLPVNWEQQGGTAATAGSKIASATIAKGSDDLGRWAWFTAGN